MPKKRSIYLIGSLRNPNIPRVGDRLREQDWDVFDHWHSAGKDADQEWRDYELARGHNFQQALNSLEAQHTFAFDLKHLTRCDTALLICPAGKSGHLELGWKLGRGAPGFILHDAPDRFDLMYRFATAVYATEDEMLSSIKRDYRRAVNV